MFMVCDNGGHDTLRHDIQHSGEYSLVGSPTAWPLCALMQWLLQPVHKKSLLRRAISSVGGLGEDMNAMSQHLCADGSSDQNGTKFYNTLYTSTWI